MILCWCRFSSLLVVILVFALPTAFALDVDRSNSNSRKLTDSLVLASYESDGVGVSTIADVEFNYDFALSLRLWVGYETADRVGLRATYFRVDTNAPTLTANPPANGFGQIGHPSFGLIDISSTIPTDSVSARTGLDLFSIDLEITKHVDFETWSLLASAGVRYASIKQKLFRSVAQRRGRLGGTD